MRGVLAAAAVAAVLGMVTVSATSAEAADAGCNPAVPQYVLNEPPALARMSAAAAWTLATGRGVVVAVVDSGVDTGNAHLAAAGVVLPGVDLVGVAGDPGGRTDTSGHGTAVAGEIAARKVDTSGVVGFAPESVILPVRAYYGDDDQSKRDGTAPDAARLAAGIEYAATHGARIINVSSSSNYDSPDLRAAVATATSAGALVVASAGNRNTTTDVADSPRYPAAYPEVLSVTAVDDADRPTDDSIHGPHVDVAAPGTNVLTTFHAAGDCMLSSTASSWATAYVSAAAALLAERFPDESPAEWHYRLEVTAARSQPATRDDLVGWGVVRPDQALAFVDDGTALGPESPTHPRPSTTARAVQVVDLTPATDEFAQTRRVAGWWVAGGASLLVVAGLAARLAGRPRRRRTPAL